MNHTQTVDTQSSPGANPGKPARRRRLWPWVLLAVVLTVLVLAAATAAWLAVQITQAPQTWNVTLQAEELLRQVSRLLTQLADTLADVLPAAGPWLHGLDWRWDLSGASVFGLTMGMLLLFAGLLVLLLCLVTLLPMLVLAIGAGGLVTIMAALLLAAAVAALAVSPLWLPVLGLLWWWRRKAAAAPPPNATTATTTTAATP